MDMENTALASQYLTFTLGKEIFASDISAVREVLEVAPLTQIPQTPAYVKGALNLRGHVVPVVDMRMKFGMPEAVPTVETCIIIVEIPSDGDKFVMGILVDSVREVFDLPPNEISPAPRFGTVIKADYICGIGRQGNKFVTIVDVTRIFSKEEITGGPLPDSGPSIHELLLGAGSL